MHAPGPNFPRRRSTPGGWLLFGAALVTLGPTRTADALGNYRPANVHRAAASLPADLRRVAVLPLAVSPDSFELGEGRAALEPLLQAELAATKRFEVVRISPAQLRARTGRPVWSGAEVLPADFFGALRAESACDAVMFCELTVFRAYAPLAVGWRLRLVDARSQETLWAADEVFDAARPDVAHGARRFDRQGADGWAVLNSPRRFGTYAAATVLATLPRLAPEKPPPAARARPVAADGLRPGAAYGPEGSPRAAMNLRFTISDFRWTMDDCPSSIVNRKS